MDTNQQPDKVWILNHVHIIDEDQEEIRLIGIYSSQEEGEEAIKRATQIPGFVESLHEFTLNACLLDKDNWTSGFVEVPVGERW